MFLLYTLGNIRNEDTGKERSKEDKQSSTIGPQDISLNIQ